MTKEKCPKCNGSGRSGKRISCPKCKGYGTIIKWYGRKKKYIQCDHPDCDKGKRWEICYFCGGSGYVKWKEEKTSIYSKSKGRR